MGMYFNIGGSPEYSGTWTQVDAPTTNNWRGVAWSPTLNLFVAVGDNHATNYEAITSSDGINWSEATGMPDGGYTDIVWSPEEAIFVAVQTLGPIATSPDGITWTQRITPADIDDLRGICWSADKSLFVSVGSNDVDRVVTSPDGFIWTDRDTVGDAYYWNDVTYSPSLGLFCAVSNFVPSNQTAMTSTDGITWTLRTMADTFQPQGVDWSPSLGMFVAAGNNIINTSTDGITWTTQTPPAGSNDFSAVFWCAEMAKFFISNLSVNLLSYSSDGINWSNTVITDSHNWERMAYSPSLKRLVVVSAGGGAIDTIMYSDSL